MKFDRCLRSIVAETPVKFQSDMIISTPCFAALSLCKILE